MSVTAAYRYTSHPPFADVRVTAWKPRLRHAQPGGRPPQPRKKIGQPHCQCSEAGRTTYDALPEGTSLAEAWMLPTAYIRSLFHGERSRNVSTCAEFFPHSVDGIGPNPTRDTYDQRHEGGDRFGGFETGGQQIVDLPADRGTLADVEARLKWRDILQLPRRIPSPASSRQWSGQPVRRSPGRSSNRSYLRRDSTPRGPRSQWSPGDGRGNRDAARSQPSMCHYRLRWSRKARISRL